MEIPEPEERVTKSTPATADLDQLVGKMEGETAAPDNENLDAIVQKIARAFGVKDDEVAILSVDEKRSLLRFIVPEKLKIVGTIPLTSTNALAAKTAREKRAETQNNFGNARHASVFEGVPLGRSPGETIQKIMSAPILADNKSIGVIQISKKGRSVDECGADFRSDDLRKLQAVAASLVKLIRATQKS